MARELLPARRGALAFSFEHAYSPGSRPHMYHAAIGFYDDGRPAEVFLNAAKLATDSDAYARDAAIAISIALQFGVPLDTMRHAITRNPDGTAASPIGSLLDLMCAEVVPAACASEEAKS